MKVNYLFYKIKVSFITVTNIFNSKYYFVNPVTYKQINVYLVMNQITGY